MPRYIDADKFLIFGYQLPDAKTRSFADGVTYVLDKIHEAPTEDVEPVIHAHWITCGIFDDFVKCSHCGWKAPFSLIGDFNIVGCPGCRAKMDEERKNEDGRNFT